MLMVVHEGVVARSLTPCTARGGLASLLVRAAASTTTTATSSSTSSRLWSFAQIGHFLSSMHS